MKRTVKVIDGGDYVTNPSAETANPSNYIRNINTRRDQDHETLAYGWTSIPIDPPEPPQKLYELVQANGRRAIFAFADQHIFKWDHENGEWLEMANAYTSGGRWSADDFNGVLVFSNGIDPVSYLTLDSETVEYIHELRELGVVTAGIVHNYNGLLLLVDVTELVDGEPVRTPYKLIFSDDPFHWRWTSLAKINVSEDRYTLQLEAPTKALKVGDVITYVETVEGDDDLTAILSEVTITALSVGDDVNGYQYLTVDTPVEGDADTEGVVIRRDYYEQVVGWEELQGSGSPIIGVAQLQETLILMARDRFIIGQLTGEADQIFAWDQLSDWEGLSHRDLFCTLSGSALLYRGQQKWYTFDLVNRIPTEAQKLELIRDLMEFETTGSYSVVENTIHNEVWIMTGSRTIVWDYRSNRCSELDVAAVSGLSATHPETWNPVFFFILDGSVKAFAIDYATEKTVYLRDGWAYEGLLEFGLFSDQHDELVLMEYRPVFNMGSPSICVIELYYHHRTDLDGVKLGERHLSAGIQVRAHARGQAFHDVIRFTEPVKLWGRVWEYKSQPSAITGIA